MKKRLLTVALSAIGCDLIAQDTIMQRNAFTWSVFADTYYSYDFNKSQNQVKPSFLYNHNRHNEFNLNLALVRASYTAEK